MDRSCSDADGLRRHADRTDLVNMRSGLCSAVKVKRKGKYGEERERERDALKAQSRGPSRSRSCSPGPRVAHCTAHPSDIIGQSIESIEGSSN